jgi:diaminopimelate epimerase
MRFAKYEGLGNDFLVVDADREDASWLGPAEVQALCDRHRGVGADGVLLTGWSGGGPFMQVYNADGSRPEMCGNGIRCVALHLYRRERAGQPEIGIGTDAGEHRCRIVHAEEPGSVQVSMRAYALEPDRVPVQSSGPLVDAPVEVDGETIHLTALSLGNPHAVTFEELGARADELGPRLGADARFPSGVNVGFARLEGARIVLRVFERGSGWTRACGTGACAAAVAAVETGRAKRGQPIEVTLPGGTLEVMVGQRNEPVRMTGPARHVFDGELAPEHFRGSTGR